MSSLGYVNHLRLWAIETVDKNRCRRKLFQVCGLLILLHVGHTTLLMNVSTYPAEVHGTDVNVPASTEALPSQTILGKATSRNLWYGSARGSDCLQAKRYPGQRILPVTALLSAPGSGNTWLRWLIERLTGICTGSLYKEFALRKAGFLCEMLTPSTGNAIVYKTHYLNQINASKVILLVRNPFDAIFADYNRIKTGGSHVSVAKSEDFYTNEWHTFVVERSIEWLAQIEMALQDSEELLVVFYENLRKNLAEELEKVANFLRIKATNRRVNCTVENSDGVARRPMRPKPRDIFTNTEHQSISSLVSRAYDSFRRKRIENIPEYFHLGRLW